MEFEMPARDRADGRNMPVRGDLWRIVSTVYNRRFLIASATAAAAIAAVVISLLIPNTYLASSRLLMPSSGSGGLLGMLADLPSAARGFLGGRVGDYTRFLALLTSRSMMESVVDEFDLVEVYDLADSKHPREAAIGELASRVDFVVDSKYEFLSVEVVDEDPGRAAEMANFFVEKLNEMNARLSAQSAGKLRYYVDRRYTEAIATLDSVLNAARDFQSEYGVFNLEVQAEGFFTQLAEMRGLLARAEVQYETLRDQFGPENEQVRAALGAVTSARRAYQSALAGQEHVLPVPASGMPNMVRAYLDLERERMIQMEILKALAPMVEQARFEEERQLEAVQIVDVAVPPVKKHAPKRSIIVVLSTATAFALAVIAVLIQDWWRRRHVHVLSRLREESIRVT